MHIVYIMSRITDADIVKYFKAITDPNATLKGLQQIYNTVNTTQETCEDKMKNYKDCILKKLQEIANYKGKNVYLYLTPETINSIYTTDNKVTLPDIVELNKKNPTYTFQPSDFDNALAIFKHKGNITDMKESIKQINQDFIIKFVNYKPPGNTTAYYFRIAAYVLYLYSSQPNVPVATEIVTEVTANDTGINEEEKAIIFEGKKKLKLDARQDMAVNRFSNHRKPKDPVCFLLHGVGTGKTITSLSIALNHLSEKHMDKKVPEGTATETNPLNILIIAPQGLFSTSFKDDARSCGIYIYNSMTDVNGIESCSCLYQKGENEYFINLMGCDYNNLFKETEMIDILNKAQGDVNKKIDVLICDEAHRFLTNKLPMEDVVDVSNTSCALEDIRFIEFVKNISQSIFLTGTPIQQDSDDLVKIAIFLNTLNESNKKLLERDISIYKDEVAIFKPLSRVGYQNPVYHLSQLFGLAMSSSVQPAVAGALKGGGNGEITNIVNNPVIQQKVNALVTIGDTIIRYIITYPKMENIGALVEQNKGQIVSSIKSLYDTMSNIPAITITSERDFDVSCYLFLFLLMDLEMKKKTQSVPLANIEEIEGGALLATIIAAVAGVSGTIGFIAGQVTATMGNTVALAYRKYVEYEYIVDIDKLVEYSRNFVSVYNYDYNNAAIDTEKYNTETVEDTETGFKTVNANVINAEGNTNQFPRKHVMYVPVQFTEAQIKSINSLKNGDKYELFKATNNNGCQAITQKYKSQSNLDPLSIILQKETDRKTYGYIPEAPFKQEESTNKPEYKSINIRNSYYVKDKEIPPELSEIKNISQNTSTPDARYLRFESIFDELLYIRTGKIRYNDKIVYHPHYVLNKQQVEYYLPVVYPPTLEIMYTFCKFLDDKSVKYLWMNQAGESSTIANHFNCAAKYTFPIKEYETVDTDPICIIISPSHTEGFSFVYNPAIFVPALCITAGDQEQVYGRILRKYKNPYTIEGDKKEYKFDKFVYQYFGANEADIRNIDKFNISYGMGKDKGNLIYFKDFELIHIFKKHCKLSEKDADDTKFENYKNSYIEQVIQGEMTVEVFVANLLTIDNHKEALINNLNEYYAKSIKETNYKNISKFRKENVILFQLFRNIYPLNETLVSTVKQTVLTPYNNLFKTEQQRKAWLDEQKNPVIREIEHLSNIDATNTSSERYFNELVNCENMSYKNNSVHPEDIVILTTPEYVNCNRERELTEEQKREKETWVALYEAQGGKRTRRRKQTLTRRKKSTRAPRRKITRAKKHKNRHTKKYA